jgi:hypothetical protein
MVAQSSSIIDIGGHMHTVSDSDITAETLPMCI